MMNILKVILPAIVIFGLAGCTNFGKPQDRLYKQLSKEDRGNTHYKGTYKIGKQYTIKGKTYTPNKVINYNKTGIASWYGVNDGCHGRKTANGDKYNRNLLSAAHPTLPLPSLVKVTNLKNNKSLIVMVNDRGPFAKNRIIDVSEKAAKLLSFKTAGLTKVRVQYLHKETREFLRNIALKPKPGSKAAGPTKIAKCSVNCHIKLVNIKHNLLASNP